MSTTAVAAKPTGPAPTARRPASELTGTGKLIRGLLRRDRWPLLIWLLAVPGITLPSLSAYGDMFDTPTGAQARAAIMGTVTGTVFGGPGYGLDHYTTGAMIANELLLYLDIAVALAAILLVIRATRREEESGRAELIGSAAVGRRAGLAAALAVTSAEVVAIGLAVGLGCMVYPDLNRVDCLALGLAIAATGLAFVGVAALAAQIARSYRAATGLSAAVLGLAFLARAVGDTATVQGDSDWLSWVSPLGWANRTRVFVDLRWWPLLLALAFGLTMTLIAWWLAGRRDMGAGLLTERGGPARAGRSLNGLAGLVWRRTRTSWLAWTGGAVLLALCLGPVIGEMRQYVLENPTFARVLGLEPDAGAQAVIGAVSALMILYMAMLMTAYAIGGVDSLRTDETRGLSALVLAGPVARHRQLGAVELVVGLGALLGTLVVGVVYAAVVYFSTDTNGELWNQLVGSTFRALPGVVASVALAVFLVAARPGLFWLNWLVFAYAFIYAIVGQVLELPSWARFFAPLMAVSLAPDQSFDWAPAIVLLAVSAAIFAGAHWAYRRRDLRA